MRLVSIVLLVAACGGPARPAPAAPVASAPRPEPAPTPPATAPAPAPAPAPKPAPPKKPIRVVAVGDMMLGNTYPDERLPPNDGADLLANVRDVLRGADIAFGNLEGPMFDGGGDGKCSRMKARKRKGKQTCYAFRMPTRYARHLVDAGFDLISVANNHAWDFGEDGRESTLRALTDVGLAHSGPPGSIATVTAGNMRVAMIAFATANHSYNLTDIDAAVAAVRAADADHDLVIVSFHGGAEGRRHAHVPDGPETFYGEDRGDLRKFSRAVIDAGADLVLGHGPHVMRGLELYKQRLIAYSLGNFATYYGISIKGEAGVAAMLEVTLDTEGRFVSGRLHPIAQKRPQGPVPDPNGEAITQVQRLSAADFPDTAPVIADDGAISPPHR